MPTHTARHSIDVYRWVGTAFFVVAVAVWLIFWPHDCSGGEYSCADGDEAGSRPAMWVGLGIAVAGLFPLAVYAAAVGTQLGLRADREARARSGSTDVE